MSYNNYFYLETHSDFYSSISDPNDVVLSKSHKKAFLDFPEIKKIKNGPAAK